MTRHGLSSLGVDALKRETALAHFKKHLPPTGEFSVFYQALVRFPTRWERRLYKNTPKGIRRLVAGWKQRADLAYLRRSEGFDAAWYAQTHAGLAGAAADPLRHYVEEGERSGLRPNPFFPVNREEIIAYQKALFFGNFFAASLKEREKLIETRRAAQLKSSRCPAIQIPFRCEPADKLPDSIAVICHCYYVELLDEILYYLTHLGTGYSLYISTDTEQKKERILQALHACEPKPSKFEVRICENRGRDIAPKLITFRDVYANHTYFLHLHTKKSPHAPEFGVRWRRYLYTSLLGSPDIIRSIFTLLQQPGMGIVYPFYIDPIRLDQRWGENFEKARVLLDRMQITITENTPLRFPAGSMFWGRCAALQPLLDLNLTCDDFGQDGPVDGTVAHAVERVICLVAEKAGFRTQPVVLRDHDLPDEQPVACLDADDLPRAIRQSEKIESRLGHQHFLKSLVRRKAG